MKYRFFISILGLLITLPALAEEPFKIGMITTLSTKAGYLGEEVRDGFLLAIDQEGGKLGGVQVELLVEDDGRKPAKGKQIAERMLSRDKVDLLTGIIFSNIALAVVPGVVEEGLVYVSPNAGPSKLAGEGCHPNYFNASWQNDTGAEAMGQYLNEKGVGKIYLLAPNYPAGKDILGGFKRFYKGEVVAETYTKLGQADYAAELTNIRDAKPEAVFFFLPGGMGINFIKQYHQFGMKQNIPLYGPMFSFDERLLQAVGDAAEGVENAGQWVQDLDNPANQQFVTAFREKYGRTPTFYASQGYDAARLIASALKVTGGVEDLEAFRAAMKKADFDAVRGAFVFGNNQHPVQDYYLRKVVKGPDGAFTNTYVKTIVTGYADSYTTECGMQ